MAKATDMSPTSITRIVGELLSFGLLVETAQTHKGLGRKATMLEIDRDAVFSVGIDIDVDALQTCLIDLDNRPRSFLDRKLGGRLLTPSEAVEIAYTMYIEMLATTGIPEDKVRALGVNVGGTVDRFNGKVVVSPQLHWRNVEIGKLMEARFGLPARVENDVKSAVYEEYVRYPAFRAESVAYLTIGQGIGAAVMYNGALLRGASNAAGEIGHITVQPDGDLCDCGRRGCLYTCLSEKALLKKIRNLHRPSTTIERWCRARQEGETWAVELAEEVAGYVAMALNHIICSYDPEIVIVGGRLLYAMPELLDFALGSKGFIYEELRSDVRVMHSQSKYQDAVIGAAIMAKTHFLGKLLNEKL